MVEQYLNKTRPYLTDLVNDLKQSDTLENLIYNTINFISSKDDNNEDHVMHSKSDNIEIMSSDEADEGIKKLFDSLKNRYQNNLESMRGSKFVFDYVQLLHYVIKSVSIVMDRIDSPYWVKNKKSNNKSYQ